MTTLEVGQFYTPSTSEEVRDDILTDIRLESLRLGAEVPVSVGSDEWIWADAQSHVAMLQYANLATLRPAMNPLDATGADLDRWMDALGLPHIGATKSTGAIRLTVSGTASITAGLQGVLPNGRRFEVMGTWPAVTEGSEIDVLTIDRGADTEANSDTVVRLINPPFNVSTTARVSLSRPIRGGVDAETESRKRERVLNRLGGAMGGGNWRQLREEIFKSDVHVQKVYVYPALGGPGSTKIVVMREYDARDKRNDFSRVVDSAALTVLRGVLFKKFPGEIEMVTSASADQDIDVAITVTVPDSPLSGGNGQGWLDATVWPNLTGGDTKVSITTVNASNQITVNATTAVSPTANVTRIAWWSSVDMKFRIYTVIAKSGGTGAWVLTLDRPLVSNDGTLVATGQYISPAAAHMEAYGIKWLALMNELGCGEQTTIAGRVPRALRHPYVADEVDSSLNITQLTALRNSFPEITDAAWSYRSASVPTVPAGGVDDPPNVLTVRQFGIYKI